MALPRPIRAGVTFLVALYVAWMLAFLALPDPTGLGPLLAGAVAGLPVAAVAAYRDVPPASLVRFLLATLAALLAVAAATYLVATVAPGSGLGGAFGTLPGSVGGVAAASLAGYWLVYRDGWGRLRGRADPDPDPNPEDPGSGASTGTSAGATGDAAPSERTGGTTDAEATDDGDY